MSNQPFLGVFQTDDGKLIDMATNTVINQKDLKPNMMPFYGRFLDKDGVEHDLREITSGNNGEYSGGISDAPFNHTKHARMDGSWVPLGRIPNWRGPFQLGNMYNTDDVVLTSDGNEYIANMDGLVLPPPSSGWDEFQIGMHATWGNITGDIVNQTDLMELVEHGGGGAHTDVIVDWGVEFKTNEIRNGKRVYGMLVDCGLIPQGVTAGVQVVKTIVLQLTNIQEIWRDNAQSLTVSAGSKYSQTLPYLSGLALNSPANYVPRYLTLGTSSNPPTITIANTIGSVNNDQTIWCLVKYIKTTD